MLLKGHQQNISVVRVVCERYSILLLFILLADICLYCVDQWLAMDARLLTDRMMSRISLYCSVPLKPLRSRQVSCLVLHTPMNRGAEVLGVA